MPREYIRQVSIQTSLNELGDILFFDNFEIGADWEAQGTGSDWEVFWDKGNGFTNKAGVTLRTKETTPAENDFVEIYKLFPVIESRVIKATLNFYTPTIANIKQIRVSLIRDDNSNLKDAKVAYLPGSTKWQYNNASDALADIPDGAQTFLEAAWHLISIKVNYPDNRYIRLQSQGLNIDLTGLSMFQSGTGNGTYNGLYIRVIAAGAARAEISIDNVFIKAEGN
tara:strand:- start:944 stop:1618 length:675 start_codon:yes stop_codon:yes gene_type:complete